MPATSEHCLQRVYTILAIGNFQASVIKSAYSDQNLRSVTFWHRFGIGSLQIKFLCQNKQIFVSLKLQEMCILAI